MKKLLALLLALLMVFSVATIALAADDETPADPATTSEEPAADEENADGEGFDIMNIQLWQAKFGLKVGKILLKLVKAVVKVLVALRIVDKNEIAQTIINLFGLEGAEAPAEPAVE